MIFIYVFFYFQSVFNRAQGKYFIRVDSFKFRFYRFCTRGQNEFVIAFLKDLAVLEIFDGDGFLFRMNCRNLVIHIHPHSKPFIKAFRCL